MIVYFQLKVFSVHFGNIVNSYWPGFRGPCCWRFITGDWTDDRTPFVVLLYSGLCSKWTIFLMDYVLNEHVNSVKTPRVSHPCHKLGHRLIIITRMKVWVLLHLGWNRDFWEWTIAKYPLLMTACGQWSTVIFVLIYFDPTMHHFIILNDQWFINSRSS